VLVLASNVTAQRVQCRHCLAVVSTVWAPHFGRPHRSRRQSEADRLERRLHELVVIVQLRLRALTQRTTLRIHI
jgi:hypothetical protein